MNTKKGQASQFGKVVKIMLGIMAIIIVLRYTYISVGNSKDFTSEFVKLQDAGLNFSDKYNFSFKAESVNIVPLARDDGTQAFCDKDSNGFWSCARTSTVRFEVSISNNGAEPMRRYFGSVIMCRSDDKKCANKVTTTAISDCVVSRGETKDCDAGKYTFPNAGIYTVIPVAECALEAKTGCLVPGVPSDSMVKNSNIAKSVKITIV